jgi:chorismate mutase
VHLFAERFRCTHVIGELKARHGLASRDPDRGATQLRRLRDLATASRLDSDFVEDFHAFVVQEVVRKHETLLRNIQRDNES